MTKQELFEAFDKKVTKAAIVDRDGEWVIKGRYCIVAPESGGWDVWICNPDDMAAGLSKRVVSNRVRTLEKVHVGRPWEVLDGEAYGWVPSAQLILSNLKLLGIRKARKLSPEQREAAAKRLAKARSAKSS